MTEDATLTAPAQFVPAAPVARTVMTTFNAEKEAPLVQGAVKKGVEEAPDLRNAGLYVAAERASANRQMAASIAGETNTIANTRPAVPAGAAGEAVLASAIEANRELSAKRASLTTASFTPEADSKLVAAGHEQIVKLKVDAQPAVIPAATQSPVVENKFSGAVTLAALELMPQKPGPSFAAFLADFAPIQSSPEGVVLYDSGKFSPAAPAAALAFNPPAPEATHASVRMPSTAFLAGQNISKFDMLAASMQDAARDARFTDVPDLLEGSTISKVASGKSLGFKPPMDVPVVALEHSPSISMDAEAMAMAARRARQAQYQPRGPQSYGQAN